jgi:hypothetical protein
MREMETATILLAPLCGTFFEPRLSRNNPPRMIEETVAMRRIQTLRSQTPSMKTFCPMNSAATWDIF